jgi:hypothetical protein
MLGDDLEQRLKAAKEKNILPGVSLECFYPELSGHLLVATTELHRDEDIERLADIISGVSRD